MGVNIQFSQSYHWLNSWILANVIQLATQDFVSGLLIAAWTRGGVYTTRW